MDLLDRPPATLIVRRLLLAAGAIAAVLALHPTPAWAHPFGEPQTARLSAEGSQVTIRWSAPADDLRVLGGAVGALPDRRVLVFDTAPGADPEPVGQTEADLLTSSPDVAAYLESHIAVRQEGQDCRADAALDDLVGDGARMVFDCPRVVDEVEIEITMLTDIHEAYRTVAIADEATPDRQLYTVDERIQAWSFAGGEAPAASGAAIPPTQLGAFEQHLVRVFDRAVAAPLALLVAAAVGAAHGLSPGHGKTLAAAYLVGARAPRRQVLVLAATVAAMHTASVMLLGVVWWVAVGEGRVPVDTVTRGARLAAAVVVFIVGLAITRRRWQERRSSHDHQPPVREPHRVPAHRLAGARPRLLIPAHRLAGARPHLLIPAHRLAGARPHPPRSWPGLVGIASVGGLLPSPSAFLVLISGLLTGRVVLALSMVGAFAVGLASTVLVVGLLTVSGRKWLDGHMRFERLLGHLPLVGAAGVLLGGLVLCVVALSDLLTSV